MEFWILVRKNASPAQPLTNIMDINTRKVLKGYNNHSLIEKPLKKWILHGKNKFFVRNTLYFGTISGYFVDYCMLKECLYGKKCNDMEYICLKYLYWVMVVMYQVI